MHSMIGGPQSSNAMDLISRLGMHVCLIVAMAMMISVTHKIEHDAVVKYNEVPVSSVSPASGLTVFVPDFESTTAKEVNIFNRCTENAQWINKHPDAAIENWNRIMKGSVKDWATIALVMLSIQALYTLAAIVFNLGRSNVVGGGAGLSLEERVDKARWGHMWQSAATLFAITTAVFTAIAVTHFFIGVATRDNCNAGKTLAENYYRDSAVTDDAAFAAKTKADYLAQLKARCLSINNDLTDLLAHRVDDGVDDATTDALCFGDATAGEETGVTSPAFQRGCAGFGMTSTTSAGGDGHFQDASPTGATKGIVSGTKIVTYMLNCDIDTSDVTSDATKDPFDNAVACADAAIECNKFPDHAENIRKTLKTIRDHTRSIVWLVGISIGLLSFHVMGIGTIVRRTSTVTRLMQTLNNTFMSVTTLAWYSVAMGSYFLWIAGQNHKGTTEAWKQCPVALATDSGFDTIDDEKKAENFHQISYIMGFITIVLGLFMSLMFRNTLTFRNNPDLHKYNSAIVDYADQMVNMHMSQKLVSLVLGATGSAVAIVLLYPTATQASTLCSLVREDELGREATSYTLAIYGIGIIVALAIFYIHVGFAGLINAGSTIKFILDPIGFPTAHQDASIRRSAPALTSVLGRVRVGAKMGGNEALLAEFQELN